MSEEFFIPQIPFVWNAPEILKGERHYQSGNPFESYLPSTQSIFGVVHELNSTGVSFLERLFYDSDDLKGKLIVFVQAAGQTGSDELRRLLTLKQQLPERFDIRLQALKGTDEKPANVVCCFNAKNSEILLFTGPAVNFNQSVANLFPPIANLAFRCDTVLQKSFADWFDFLWSKSVLVSPETISIPTLVPARGTLEATLKWEEYLAKCRNELIEAEEKATLDEAANTNGSKSNDEKKKTATEELGIPKVDEIAEKIARIFALGNQVTIDKTTRIPPLDAPIKPEWFGVDSLRQVGAVKRTIQYRVSVFTQDALKQLDNKRKKAADLLKRLSLPLGDGVHWMPENTFPLFEQEMNRVNEEGQQQLQSVLGKDANSFVDSQKAKIIKDANSMLQDFQPGGQLSEEHANDLISDLKNRLKKASDGKFLPKVSRVTIGFKLGDDSEWESGWGQALTFLEAIAEYPRKFLTDRYFFQGLRIDEDKLIQAMNVCDDYLCSQELRINPRRQAEVELDFLKRLAEYDGEPRDKCEAILNLLKGKTEEEIWELLNIAKKHKEQTDQKTEPTENIRTNNGNHNL